MQGRGKASREIHILFDGPPSHESGRFIEVEDENGYGLGIGRWEEINGLWHLILSGDSILKFFGIEINKND